MEPLLVGTGEGLLEVRSLQVEGEEEISATAFAAGNELSEAKFQNL